MNPFKAAQRFFATSILVALCVQTSSPFAAGVHAQDHALTDSIGVPGKAAKINRTITVKMNDAMRFTPSSIQVVQGETIRISVVNLGKIKHEMVLGSEAEIKAHEALMKKHPDMEHADENQISLNPDSKGSIIWQFTKSGKVSFACLQPGHYDAGMKGTIHVVSKKKKLEKNASTINRDSFTHTIQKESI
jgi:uncharacterized cupredoxin-like copper-binding protein